MVAKAKRKRRKRRKGRIVRIGTIGKDSEGNDVPRDWSFDCYRMVAGFEVLELPDGGKELLVAGYTIPELKAIAEAAAKEKP